MIRHRIRFALLAAMVAGATGLTACRDVAGLQERSRVTLSVSTPRPSSTASTTSASTSLSGAASGTTTTVTPLRRISGNGHVLDVQSADLTVRDIRLDLRDGGGDEESDSDGRHSNDGVFRSGPVTIALPLDGGVLTPFTGEIPFGTYDELEADLDFLRLRGTYDGQPFDATIEIDRELAIRLRPPLVIDADHPAENVTLNVDIGRCFVDTTGTPLDPRRLSTSGTLRSAVRDCVKRTLRAFEDHDRDGDDEDSDSDRS